MLRRAAKAAVAGALTAVGVHHAVHQLRRRQAGGTRVLILSYHRVTPTFEVTARDSLASLLVSVDALRRQLEHVGRTHEFVSLSAARRILAEPNVHLLVAFEGDEPVGFLVAHELLRPFGDPVRLFVREVRVRKERRREGIGRRLLEALWDVGRERDAGTAFALADAGDREALAFYSAGGGRRAGRELVVIRFGTATERAPTRAHD
jgi:GNAT superfamily N-acetyltransferase